MESQKPGLDFHLHCFSDLCVYEILLWCKWPRCHWNNSHWNIAGACHNFDYWFCLARHWTRIPVAFVGIVALGIFIEMTEPRRGQFDWLLFSIPGMIALPIVLTVEPIKFFLGRFQKLDEVEPADFDEGIQFNIRQLLILTAVVAGLCGLWNVFSDSINAYFSRTPRNDILIFLFKLSATMATFTLLSIWSLLGMWKLWRFIVAVLVGAIACGVGVYSDPFSNRQVWITLYAICWSTLLFWLFLIRTEGYRFVRKQHGEQVAES